MIQGQNYCLNCGFAVTVGTPAPSKVAKSTKPVAAVAVIPSVPSRRRQEAAADIRMRPDKKPLASSLHPLRFSLLVALIAAAVSGVVTAAILWFNVDSDTGAYVIAATAVTLGITVCLAHTALLYGTSRLQDGRPASREYWWIAARSGFMDVANVQMMAIICSVVLVGVGLIAWRVVDPGSTHGSMLLADGVLGITNIVLIWALLGVYAAARLATSAVVVGGLNATEAVRVGWRLYLKAGGHLAAAALEALFSRALVAILLAVVGYAAVTHMSASGPGALALASGVGIAIVVFCICILALEVDTKLWLTQYRHLATLCSPAERIRLLTGRVQSHTTS
jgi:hypothetical protein